MTNELCALYIYIFVLYKKMALHYEIAQIPLQKQGVRFVGLVKG